MEKTLTGCRVKQRDYMRVYRRRLCRLGRVGMCIIISKQTRRHIKALRRIRPGLSQGRIIDIAVKHYFDGMTL